MNDFINLDFVLEISFRQISFSRMLQIKPCHVHSFYKWCSKDEEEKTIHTFYGTLIDTKQIRNRNTNQTKLVEYISKQESQIEFIFFLRKNISHRIKCVIC